MENRTYEVHNLSEKDLPIIFHYDVVFGRTYTGNWHDNIELLYINKGQGQIVCNGEEYDVQPGDLVVINCNELHASRSDSLLEYYCLIVDTGFLQSNQLAVGELEFENFVHSPEARQLYRKIVEEIQSQYLCRIAAIRAQVLELLVYLARNHASHGKKRLSADENIKLAIGYLRSNYAKPLTLEEVAREVGLSKYHFSREFKKATGMTLVTYLNAVRCENARKLLLKRKYSVSEVAARCGFVNCSYFSKIFRSVMGCLPSEIGKRS